MLLPYFGDFVPLAGSLSVFPIIFSATLVMTAMVPTSATQTPSLRLNLLTAWSFDHCGPQLVAFVAAHLRGHTKSGKWLANSKHKTEQGTHGMKHYPEAIWDGQDQHGRTS